MASNARANFKNFGPLFYLPYYALYLGAKTLGALAAHHADRLPQSWRRRYSLHRYYWKT